MTEQSSRKPTYGNIEIDKKACPGPIALKWQAEIRTCLNSRLGLATALEIAENIATSHTLPLDHIMRQRVSATLAAMHGRMEIGRLKKSGEKNYCYGHRRYFEDDLKTPKQEYQDLLFD